jgi:FtsZ-binding cell division protein ZapB
MSAQKQLSFWDLPITKDKLMWMELNELKAKQNNLRRGLFGRFDELQKEVESLQRQIVFLLHKGEK